MSLLSSKFWQRLWRRTNAPSRASSRAKEVLRKRFQLEELESRLTPSGAWSPAASLNIARDAQTATLLNSGKVLLAGGNQGGGVTGNLASAEVYDPSANTWTVTDNTMST